MTTGLKKSEFSSLSSIPSGATFDFVINGMNYKIPVADMIAAFGTVGTLQQQGDLTGIAVLDVDGTVNNIRNIIGGSGIVASVSASDGIKLDHNFIADTTGSAVLKDPTSTSPTIRSIQGGTGISVATVNGYIQIALSATPVSNKTVIVNEIADFPTAVSSVITLEDDTMYFITNDLATANRFVLGENTVLTGSDGTLITLEYTGSGTMLTSLNSSNKLRDIALTASSGTLFDITGSGTELFQMISCRAVCDTVGTIDGVFVANFNSVLWTVTTDGITFENNNSVISFTSNVGAIAAGTFVDLGTSTTDGFTFTNSLGVLPAGATFISGAADSANINAGGLATVLNTRAQGAGTSLVGITTKDDLWDFFGNNGIDDSRDSLLATNAGATVTIAAPATPVIIGATWVEQDGSRLNASAGGRFTYTGKGSHVDFSASITADIAGGTKIDCTFFFYKNGTIITASGVARAFTAGNPGNFSMLWSDDLETDDYIEVFAQNDSGTANIVISQAIVRFS